MAQEIVALLLRPVLRPVVVSSSGPLSEVFVKLRALLVSSSSEPVKPVKERLEFRDSFPTDNKVAWSRTADSVVNDASKSVLPCRLTIHPIRSDVNALTSFESRRMES